MPFDLSDLLQRAQHFGTRYRRGIVASALLGLAGFTITAFGIAPMAPDAAKLPQQLIAEVVPTDSLTQQVEALAAQPLNLWRSDVLRGSESAEGLLRRVGANDPAAARFLRSDPQARNLLAARTRLLQARIGAMGELLELQVSMPAVAAELQKSHFTRVTIKRDDGQWTSRTELAPLVADVRLASATIRSSLFAATDEARIPDSVATQLADIFGADIDFHRELRRGDSLHVVYESLSADGQPVPWNEGAGRVLAAEFVNKGHAYHALWFAGNGAGNGMGSGAGANEPGGYFDLDGSSRRRSFLASPLQFSRVTSGFANRFHPIFNQWRKHLGVDYGAPSGTPVRAVGDGVVDFAGWQNGYGKVVILRHGNDRSTLYAHLSAYQVHKGERVSQGETLGNVGSTGWATGPHLHFEFRVHGLHQDPLLIARSAEHVQLSAAAHERFNVAAKALQGQLDLAESLTGARARFE